VLAKLIELGNLGQKTGFYKKVGRDILRFELDSEDYVPAGQKADEVYGRMLKKPAAERLKLLRNAEGAQASSCGPFAQQLPLRRRAPGTIADTARDVDQAMRWGFGMKQGPFELWQEAGWLEVAKMVQEDIDAGKALCKAPLPAGCSKARWPRPAACTRKARGARHRKVRAAPRAAGLRAPALPREAAGRDSLPDWQTAGTTMPNQGAAHLDAGRQVLIASIKNKMHAISPEVMEGLMEAVERPRATTRAW
jgi:3-hydroxyacyl-CoA dehydrogenase